MKSLIESISAARKFNLPTLRALCIGNVSADMDSVVGSLVMSQLISDNTLKYTPVILCQKEELPLRIEIVQHLEKHGMSLAWVHENVLFKEDLVNLEGVQGIGLVDFNLLPKNLEHLGSKVKHVIDHHVDNGAYKDTCITRKVQLMGSATSLVTNSYFEKGFEIDSDLALFLSAPISLDTYNFKDDLYGHKWNDIDRDAFKLLQEQNSDLKDHPAKYWEDLNNAKTDVKANLALGIKNILIKDFKTYEIVKDGDHMRGIGASSIRVPTNTILEFFGQDKVIGCMREMMQKLDLVMFFILPTLSDKDSMRKEMVIYSDAELIDDDISKFHELRDMLKVNKDYMLKNQVDLDTGKEGERLIHWEVGNTKMSRKELEKLMKEYFANLATLKSEL